jgi:5-methylcytosine-specific restriction endonuclease McrA
MTLEISGMRFGKLIAIRRVGSTKAKDALWECVCDCGVVKNFPAGELHRGHVKSCSRGCGHVIDLVGKRFGRLVVKRRTNGVSLCECLCDCGKTITVPPGKLTRSYRSQKSCGCGIREKANRIVGKIFGRLTVRRVEWTKTRPIALCECKCGNETRVRVSQLLDEAVLSCGCLKNRRGKECPRWRHDLSQEERALSKARAYGWPELKILVRRIFERDGYRCKCCGNYSSQGHPLVLNAHHLIPWSNNVELRLNESNIITVCYPCHRFFHSLYGKNNNTPEQFDEFVSFFIQERRVRG